MYDSAGDYGVRTYQYDKKGNLRFMMDASGRSEARFSYYKYDFLDRVTEEGVYTGDTLQMSWVNATNRTFPASGNTVLASYEYDRGQFGGGRLTKSTVFHNGDPDAESREEFVYDAYGRVISKDARVFEVDDVGPRTTSAVYDLTGNVLELTYPSGNQVHFAYDQSGRIDSIWGSDGLSVGYDYWPSGKMRQKRYHEGMSGDEIQTVDYRYDARDWLLAINGSNVASSVTGGGDHYRLGLTYTEGAWPGSCNPGCPLPNGYYNGNIASYELEVSPGGGDHKLLQRFAYDGLDRLLQEYTALGGVPQDTLEYYYSANGDIGTITHTGPQSFIELLCTYYDGTNRVKGNSIWGMDYTYTPSGSVSEYLDRDMTMEYDQKEQLIHRERPMTYGTNEVDYHYNNQGLRIAKVHRYAYRYQCGGGGGGEPLGWDNTGGVDDAAWPSAGCGTARSADDRFAFLESPALSAPSDRTDNIPKKHYRQSIPSLLACGITPLRYCTGWHTDHDIYYYFGGNLTSEYVGDLDDGVELWGDYVYANGERVARLQDDGSDLLYYLNDHLGSTVAVVDTAGTLRNWYQYRPFGDLLADSRSAPNHYEYTGKERDGELGIDWLYYGARYYDPELRRFTSVDPQAEQYPSWSPYVYTLDNPMKYVDPDGQAAETIADVASVGMSAYDLWQEPSWENAGWLALDIVCAGVPFLPAAGIVRHAGKLEKLADAIGLGKVLGKADDAVDVAKAVPNPGGRLGGPAHRAGVADAADFAGSEFKGQNVSVTLEGKITTPGGEKGTRYGDVVVTREKQPVKVYQVGKTLKDGKTPVSRERAAIRDIQKQGIETEFFPLER
jgi:RHS repeat-associated protein